MSLKGTVLDIGVAMGFKVSRNLFFARAGKKRVFVPPKTGQQEGLLTML